MTADVGASLSRRLAAEGLGTSLLVAAVIGSGIMADRLTEDGAVTLAGNAVATGAMLFVLITIFGPISGAHFNPVVSLVLAIRGELRRARAAAYAFAQLIGGISGTMLAHAMFELPLLQVSTTIRTGPGQWLAEAVATFGLVFVILSGARARPQAIAGLVSLYIVAAYWFTASTSFANPAVAAARAFTDTFAGIRPFDLSGFVLSEILGALAASVFTTWLFADTRISNSSIQAEPTP
jgi:glycerol uptake facilitator-like aquaporin